MNKNKIYISLTSLLIISVIIVPLIINHYKVKNNFTIPFNIALKYEMLNKPEIAIRYYECIDQSYASDLKYIWIYDYKARCYFVIGEYNEAYNIYNDLYSEGELTSKPSHFAKILMVENLRFLFHDTITNEEYEEYINYCNHLIERISNFGNRLLPGIDYIYYSHSSEGYIRKYYILKKLGIDQEAETLFQEYMIKYENDVRKNYWKKLDKVKVE